MKMILRRLAILPRRFSLNRPLSQVGDDHGKLIEKWSESLENAKVPEVQSALDNILGHVLQTKEVSCSLPIRLADMRTHRCLFSDWPPEQEEGRALNTSADRKV